MSFASARATDYYGYWKLACKSAIPRHGKLTRNDVLEEGLEARVVGTHRVLQDEGHGPNALVAQLVVDKGQILEAIVPKREL